jgi:hypothetical protein
VSLSLARSLFFLSLFLSLSLSLSFSLSQLSIYLSIYSSNNNNNNNNWLQHPPERIIRTVRLIPLGLCFGPGLYGN